MKLHSLFGIAILFTIYYDVNTSKFGHVYFKHLSPQRSQNASEFQGISAADFNFDEKLVLIEESTSIYWKHPNEYIHRGKQTFDTGLELDLLQEFILIPLDIFRNMPHNNIDKLEAWLYFIGSDEPKDIIRVVEAYPEFKEFYKELIGLRYDMKGLTSMFDYYRQLLREADEGTVQYMIEEQKREIEENQLVIAEQKQELAEQKQELAEQKQELAEQKQELADKDKQLAEERKKNAELEAKLAELMNK